MGRNAKPIRVVKGSRASGGSRTRNPRITNAVLCQLKLRWRRNHRGGSRVKNPLASPDRPSPSRKTSAEHGQQSSRGGNSRCQWGYHMGLTASPMKTTEAGPPTRQERPANRECGSGARRPHARHKVGDPAFAMKNVGLPGTRDPELSIPHATRVPLFGRDCHARKSRLFATRISPDRDIKNDREQPCRNVRHRSRLRQPCAAYCNTALHFAAVAEAIRFGVLSRWRRPGPPFFG